MLWPCYIDKNCLPSKEKLTGTRGFSKATATKPRFHSYCQQVTNVASAPGDKATAPGFLKTIGLLGLV